MKKSIFTALSLAAIVASGSAMASDVGVSVSIGQPGFYGQLDIGNVRPQVVYSRPVIVQRPVVGYVEQPLYLRVPPGHIKNWNKNCYRYGACGRQVFFVQDNWYNNVYAPQYRQRYEHVEERRDYRREERHDDWRDDRHDGRRDDDHGHGKGHDKHGRYD